jgi:excisionase family DNA binding protein
MIGDPDDLLTREEAAQILRVHVATIDRARKNGDLVYEGTAGRVRIRRSELTRYSQRHNGRNDG